MYTATYLPKEMKKETLSFGTSLLLFLALLYLRDYFEQYNNTVPSGLLVPS
jgi:hypothetical protein